MPELIATALRYAPECNSQLGTSVAEMMQLLINGLVPPSVAPWIVGGRLVPIGAKVRPIVVSDVLGRLTSKIAIASVQASVSVMFKGIQGGVGEPCAIERTVHLLKTDLENHRDHLDWAILSTDFRNGFNLASRKHIAEQVELHAPRLSKWFQWSYGLPLQLRLATGECMQSEEGTCQGDPTSPLWFSEHAASAR